MILKELDYWISQSCHSRLT